MHSDEYAMLWNANFAFWEEQWLLTRLGVHYNPQKITSLLENSMSSTTMKYEFKVLHVKGHVDKKELPL
jgi:hypothetical protein